MDLNEPVLERVTFDDESLEGSSYTPTNATGDFGLGKEEDGAESDGSGSDGDYDMEEDLNY